jgi:hypothetical protein
VVQTRWLWSLSTRVVRAGIFCLFFLEVQEEFVVGEEGGLGVFDLRCVRSVLWRVEIIEVGD